jgi:hypothetical protein
LEEDLVRAEDIATSEQGLNRLSIVEWLCAGFGRSVQAWCPREIGTSGSGPWPVEDFDRLLESLGFRLAHLPNPGLKCIVLGSQDWDEQALAEQIYDRQADDLIVLPQELFIAGLLKQTNPLEALSAEQLSLLAADHPAIEWLAERGFDWAFTTADESVHEWEPTQDFAEQSPLRMAGYSVAAQGPTEEDRREVLENFFFDRSPEGVETAEERKRWGVASSAQRLYSMATFIAWLCRFRGSNAPNAADRWSDDLEWLRTSFHRRSMKFAWPGTGLPVRRPAAPRSAQPEKKPAGRALSPAAAWPFPTGNKP